MATIVEITETEMKFFPGREPALDYHYTQGGNLWKLKESERDTGNLILGEFASGEVCVTLATAYDLYMVNGREPTLEQIAEAKEFEIVV